MLRANFSYLRFAGMKHLFICGLLLLAIFLSCNKGPANPFENATTLDCNNLRVRDVDMHVVGGIKLFRVKVENTCKTCDTTVLVIYDNLFMIRKGTNDTIGYSDCFCLRAPSNKSSRTYELKRTVDIMPDPADIVYHLKYTCPDIAYLPR